MLLRTIRKSAIGRGETEGANSRSIHLEEMRREVQSVATGHDDDCCGGVKGKIVNEFFSGQDLLLL